MQELVEQVAVGAVDFHAVETGGLGVLGAGAVSVDDVGDFSGFQGARGWVVGQWANQADVAFSLDRTRSHRGFPVQVGLVGDAANVPQLQEDLAARAMHGLGDVGPAAHLVVGPDAGGVRVAHAHRCHGSGFAEDQPGGGALHVVLGHQRIGHAPGIRAAAGQRRHDDAVRQLHVAQCDRIENSRHGKNTFSLS